MTCKTFEAFRSSLKTVPALAFDCRGHGRTVSGDDADLSLNTLVEDARALIDGVLDREQSFVLMGHSMGGAVAARVAHLYPKRCVGLIVVDAVEGVAIGALSQGLEAFRNRPKVFTTVEDAVKWSTSPHGPLRNAFFSASISVPDQIVFDKEKMAFTWRTDVEASFQYWHDWYSGLSEAFLKAPCLQKMLLLPGVENLDTPLAIGQMQGKFAMSLLANVSVGHFVHEDAPGQTATLVTTFMQRVSGGVVRLGGNASASGGLTAAQVLALTRNQ